MYTSNYSGFSEQNIFSPDDLLNENKQYMNTERFTPPPRNFNIFIQNIIINEENKNIVNPISLIFSKEDEEEEEGETSKQLLYLLHSKNSSFNKEIVNLSKINKKKNIKENLFSVTKNCIKNKTKPLEKYLSKKRGRIPLKEKNLMPLEKKIKIHGADRPDNVHRKIQIHFLNFLISLANDSIKSLINPKINKRFRYIGYSSKIIVDYENFEIFKKSCFCDIFTLSLSRKYLRFHDNNKNIINKNKKEEEYYFYNEKIYNLLCKNYESDLFKKFCEQSIMTVFIKYYYNNEQKIDQIIYKEKKIKFSKKTKCFYYLLQSYPTITDIFREIIERCYLFEENHGPKGNSLFFVKKINK